MVQLGWRNGGRVVTIIVRTLQIFYVTFIIDIKAIFLKVKLIKFEIESGIVKLDIII